MLNLVRKPTPRSLSRITSCRLLSSSFDYVVVGGGSAGCVLASRLSEDKNNSVLLIEAGKKSDHYIWFHIPVGYLFTIDNPRSDWMFKTVEEKGLNGRSILYPRGLGLGGTSLINGMIYMRGQAEDYDSWAELAGDETWGWKHILPLFKRKEGYHGADDEHHNSKGPWTVSKVRTRWPCLEVFKEAAIAYGIPETEDFNTGNNAGIGYYDVSQRDGWRLSSYTAFLKPHLQQRSNLTILSEANVNTLLLDDAKKSSADNLVCKGVSTIQNGEAKEYLAKKEVILCAGSIGSVQVLERSGIGRSDVLERLGVPMAKNLEGVGENLQDHLQIRLVYKVSGLETLNTLYNSILGKIKIGLEYILSRAGPMSAAPSQLGAFLKSSKAARPDLQFHVQPLSLPKFGEPLDSFNAVTASICNMQPTSRGSIHCSSKELNAKPIISPNYLSTDSDREIAVEAISITREIFAQKPFVPHAAQEHLPGAEKQSFEDLVKAAGDIGTTIFHPTGTCKMGKETDPTAVVNAKLQVFGVDQLRVADASIMPHITSGNTAAPSMVIAEKCADILMK